MSFLIPFLKFMSDYLPVIVLATLVLTSWHCRKFLNNFLNKSEAFTYLTNSQLQILYSFNISKHLLHGIPRVHCIAHTTSLLMTNMRFKMAADTHLKH